MDALLPQSPQGWLEVSALHRCPADVPEKGLEVTLHVANPHSPLARAQPGGVLAPVVHATEPWVVQYEDMGTSEHDSPPSWPWRLQTMCAESQGAAFGDHLLFVLKLLLSYLDGIFIVPHCLSSTGCDLLLPFLLLCIIETRGCLVTPDLASFCQ